jgi:hypothetical protein
LPTSTRRELRRSFFWVPTTNLLKRVYVLTCVR